MLSTGFSCPSRSIRVCKGSARWLWPAAVMTAFLMRKEAPEWAGGRLAQKTIVAPGAICSPNRSPNPKPAQTGANRGRQTGQTGGKPGQTGDSHQFPQFVGAVK